MSDKLLRVAAGEIISILEKIGFQLRPLKRLTPYL